MAFDGITVAALAQELQNTLPDGRINKIAQPEADELKREERKRRGAAGDSGENPDCQRHNGGSADRDRNGRGVHPPHWSGRR